MRIRQHVNPLALHYERFTGVPPVLDLSRPIEIEVGCAEAQFLFERAALIPTSQYVGLEIREELVELVNRIARERDVPVTAVFCHAQLHMTELFPRASIDRAFVNFPDPWFKRKHQNRRMVDDVLAGVLAGVMKPGGEVFVQTDVWDLAIDALSAFERDERYENAAGEWTFWRNGNPYGVRSWREQNAEETNLPIWRILYRRR